MHPIYRTDVPLLPRVLFLYIQSTNIFNFFFLEFLSPSLFICPQNVVYFLMLPFLVHKIFTSYINGVLNCKCPSQGIIIHINSLTQYSFCIFSQQIYLNIFFFFLEFLSPSSFICPQNVVYFLMLPLLVHKIFTLYINGVLNCKCPAPGIIIHINSLTHIISSYFIAVEHNILY